MGKWHKFDHIAIVIKDENLEKALNFYKKLFGFDLPKTGPYSKIIEDSGHRFCLISSRGEGKDETFIEFLTAKDSYSVDLLKGEGAIVEFCVTVDDIDEWFDKVMAMGLSPINPINGNPLVNKEEIPEGSVTKSKFFYLRPSQTFGTLIEILERPGQPYRNREA